MSRNASLFPRETRDVPALGDLKPTGFWISWTFRSKTGDGRVVGEGVMRACRAILYATATPVIMPSFHSWRGTGPLTFAGHRVIDMDARNPGQPDAHVIVSLRDEIARARIRERLVWPPCFADPAQDLWPLYAVEVVPGPDTRRLEATLTALENRPKQDTESNHPAA